jgi:hypothetical protein
MAKNINNIRTTMAKACLLWKFLAVILGSGG